MAGFFITFEGCEGCGKSTQSRYLLKRLSQAGISIKLTREPGGTVLGDEIRHVLKRRRQDNITPEAEMLLFAACRIQLITEIIQPGLQKDNVIICDRYTDSTIAYQGYGRGIDLPTIETINELATKSIKPDLTILLDIPAHEGLSRKSNRSEDRFETEDIAFHEKVRNGYLKLAAQEPERWFVIDATLPKAKISNIIWDKVNQLLQTKNITKHD